MAAATQPTQQPTPASQLAAIQRRLEHWELTHLRALAAELQERLERTEHELSLARERTEHELLLARGRAMAAEDAAEMWRDQANELVDDLNALGREVGMTQSGELVTMPMDGLDIDAVHKALEPLRDAAQIVVDAAIRATTADNGYDVREGGGSMTGQIPPFRPPAPTKQPKTAVLWMPPGAGKSTHGQAVAALLGCTHVVDEWHWGQALEIGALHLTNASMQTGGAA